MGTIDGQQVPDCKCGHKAKLRKSPTGLTLMVECTKCGLHTEYHCTMAGARSEWEKKRRP